MHPQTPLDMAVLALSLTMILSILTLHMLRKSFSRSWYRKFNRGGELGSLLLLAFMATFIFIMLMFSSIFGVAIN